jgi:alkanesulfonate monooxygenase SsuD/methylene tetrahydromethanopterin reductase-like flavin-dependent oxidoreductase (luciferase family)
MEQLLDLAVMLHPEHSTVQQMHMARLASRLGFSAVHLPLPEGGYVDSEAVEQLMAAAEPAMLVVDDGSAAVGIVRSNDAAEVQRVRALLDAAEDDRPLIVAVPISIGRTLNEAEARADRDPRFTDGRHPRVCGVFGTFEQAQEQVLELARAGAEVLLVTVPDEEDVADVLAQVRALVVGATPALLKD